MKFFSCLKQVEKHNIRVHDPVNYVRAFAKNDIFSHFQDAAKNLATALQAFPEAKLCCQNILTLVALLVGEIVH